MKYGFINKSGIKEYYFRGNNMRKILIAAVSVVVGVFLGLQISPLISGDNIYGQFEKFQKVLGLTYKNYVDPVDSKELVESAIRGMLDDLDVHSVYIDAKQMKKVNEDFRGNFEGIGVEYDIINDTIVIVTPIVGGPSEKLGILANDKIVKINDSSAIGLPRDQVPIRLKGPKGTKVTVDIKRDGVPELLRFDIVRDEIPIYSVDAKFMIDGTDIGVVEVNRFAQNTHRELLDAMEELKKQGMKKLIIDLRGNPGGYLQQAFLMADEFIKGGNKIVYTRGRVPDANEEYNSTNGQDFEKIPLIVLVNAGSASASEIVSGAIQDLDRGLIVGETSFGKGLVQRQFPIGDGSAVRITIAKYYTPSGRCIQRPYKDKDKYRHLVGRFELKEGNYIDDGYDKIVKQLEEMNKDKDPKDRIHIDSLPIYHTKSGRVVLGGGGITPDYIIKQDRITDLSVELRRKNLYFLYIRDYLSGKGMKLREKYENNFPDFYRNYKIDDKMLSDFRKMAEDDGIKWNEEDYNKDKDYIKVVLKAFIARYIWNREKMAQVFHVVDKQLMKALELFPDAERVMAMNITSDKK